MQLVDLEVSLDARPETVEAALTPRTIVEYAGTYEIVSVDREGGGVAVTGVADELEVILEFVELENGYRYEQRGEHGPFEHLETWLTVVPEDEGSRVGATSEFTFGGYAAFLTDRLGARIHRRELERLLTALALDIDGGDVVEVEAGTEDVTGARSSE